MQFYQNRTELQSSKEIKKRSINYTNDNYICLKKIFLIELIKSNLEILTIEMTNKSVPRHVKVSQPGSHGLAQHESGSK